MPKSLDKTKGARKRKKTPANSSANTESDASEKKPVTKKKKVQKKRSVLEGIEMSKQLKAEVQKKRIVRVYNPTRKVNNEPRLLGNGKPMPSLAELEAMYADSEEDEDTLKQTTSTTPERCSTPVSKPIVTGKVNLDSPVTLKEITSKVIDIISKKIGLDDDDDGPRPPVIPQKKPNKSDIPYIVGCKERPQVPWAPKTKFGVGYDDYGIDENQEPDESPKERKKRGQPANISKSIFNPKSDEIAERLKQLDKIESLLRTGSPDSNKTVEYDFPCSSPKNNTLRSFSPLPSTSRDSETIQKNDILFNESLQSESLPVNNSCDQNHSPNDVEVVEIPLETIVLDDLPNTNMKTEKRHYDYLYDDDCCILDEPEIKKKRHSGSSAKDYSPTKDDIYGSIDLTETYNDDEVFVINDDDIDSLITETQVILKKDIDKNNIDTITEVTIVESDNFLPELPSTSNITNENTGSINPEQLKDITTAINPETVSSPPGVVELVEREIIVSKNNDCSTTRVLQESRSDEIAEVVTNFFNQPSTNNDSKTLPKSTNTIDLTSSTVRQFQDTMMSRISSWISSSIESFLSGSRQSSRQNLNVDNDVIVVDDSVQTLPSENNVSPRSRKNRRRDDRMSTSMMPRSSHYPKNLAAANTRSPNRESTNCCCQRIRATYDNNQSGTEIPSVSCFTCTTPSTSGQMSASSTSANLLPVQPYSSPNKAASNSPPRRSLGDCPICMDSLANNAVASTMCGHVFCMPCIKAAIRANGKKCPACRKALKGVGYHQLYI